MKIEDAFPLDKGLAANVVVSNRKSFNMNGRTRLVRKSGIPLRRSNVSAMTRTEAPMSVTVTPTMRQLRKQLALLRSKSA